MLTPIPLEEETLKTLIGKKTKLDQEYKDTKELLEETQTSFHNICKELEDVNEELKKRLSL